MIRILRAFAGLLLAATPLFTLSNPASAVENTWDYSVRVSSTVQVSPASITLTWPQDTNSTPTSYAISRKAPGATSWNSIRSLAGSETSFTDTNVTVGASYEYRVVKVAANYTGYGYIQAGINAPLTEHRGTVVLLVDTTFTSSLAAELARLQQDLNGDGWKVVRHDVARTASVATVKNLIVTTYNADRANVKSVFIFGHLAVPYSGQFNPDGHPDHIGAWPADVYYGDVDGNWTDSTVNYTQTLNTDPVDTARINNRPGDGKFDQTEIPSAVELQVGRVDLANMPGRTTWGGPATFATETELMRKYLNKDHSFRQAKTVAPRRAILGDYFGIRGGEAFAASGHRAFAPLVGPDNVRNLNIELNDKRGVWIPEVAQNAALLVYACGAGSYSTMAGLGSTGLYNDGSTTELVNADTQGVFNLLFGSWLGDWDHEDNFLRAPLATDHGLVSVWSGRPHWFIHPMALGETMGYVTRLTQNNNGLYQTQINSAQHRTHIALMGDPTLRLHPVVPATSVNGTSTGNTVALTWAASNDTNLLGYHVYRAATANSAFTRLTSSPVTATTFTDANAVADSTYMVRAIKLETTPSGTYQNPSQGAFWAMSAETTTPVVAAAAPITSISTMTVTLPQESVPTSTAASSIAPATTASSTPTLAPVTATTSNSPTGNQVLTGSTSFVISAATASEPTASISSTTAPSTTTIGETMLPLAADPTTIAASSNTVAITSADTIWVDDALPAGASGAGSGGDTWNWTSVNPAPYSGTKAHQSVFASGLHEHYFSWASEPLKVATGDTLFAYVYLDPVNTPKEIMISWNNGNWEHRAYWGSDQIKYGTKNSASRYEVGALPPAGVWVRLSLPARAVGLEGSNVTGMSFSAYGGRVTWDATGKSTAPVAPIPTVPVVTTTPQVVWIDDAIPMGASASGAWTWTASNPAPVSGTQAHSSTGTGEHSHTFSWASVPLNIGTGEKLFAEVYLDPANPPTTLMLSWNNGSWEHRAYWGANEINYGTTGTAGRYRVGDLPATGKWVRLEIPANVVALEGSSVTGLSFSAFNGRVVWDRAGKGGSATDTPTTTTTTTTTPPPTTTTTPPPTTTTTPTPVVATTPETIWFDDALPNGAGPGASGGDAWTWISSNPTPIAGTKAHQSSLSAGLHEHYFAWASTTLSVGTGEKLFAYVYLDPTNKPTSIMLSWFADNWEHRAYWGADKINYGTAGTAGRYNAGALPAAGQWVRLEIPASAVALEGKTITGMSFSQFDGRATWDKVGKGGDATTATAPAPTTTTPPPTTTTEPAPTTPPPTTTAPVTGTLPLVADSAENAMSRLLKVGDHQLRVLSPTVLELNRITTKLPDPAMPTDWNFVSSTGALTAPSTTAFAVTINGQSTTVRAVGFRRRVGHAALNERDLRIDNALFLELTSAVPEGANVEVLNPGNALWPASMQFKATAAALRFNPAIHVNQEGYVPTFAKKAIIGYFIGNLGELDVAATVGFKLVVAATGQIVHTGTLAARKETGYVYTPQPYQKVLEADFTSFATPGEYQLVVPGLGASLPFLINDGVAMNFTRTYAQGLYHQRCGTDCKLPFTRHTKGTCHVALAEIPSPQSSYSFTYTTIASRNGDAKNDPRHTAPRVVDEASLLYPFVNKGKIDVALGHHDAGDYSKYMTNSAALAHVLMFTADSVAGAGALDNLGLPESGDGVSDLMQEAKHEADYIAKMQDADGGFYFLVYPKTRSYESDVSPDKSTDTQVVWPKNTAGTAAATAALAQLASSPMFKAKYPAEAANYLNKAKLGWQFMINAINKHGYDGSYQKLTHYGHNFLHDDEFAWAAVELFAATGEAQYHTKLKEWFPDPSAGSTRRWGWWRMCESYGNAIRSYAFAVRSGRLPAGSLDAAYLAKCEAEIVLAGDDAMKWSKQSAYGTSLPEATRHVQAAGWFFSLDQAADMAVAYQLNPKTDYITALVGNMDYEGGSNPVNVPYLTGIGVKRQREIVHQWANRDTRRLPMNGIPQGNVQSGYDMLWHYSASGNELSKLSFPTDNTGGATYPFYDRWADTWNVSTEFVVTNQARGLMAVAMLTTQTAARSTAWKPTTNATINVPTVVAAVGVPVTLTLNTTGFNLAGARILWEARDQEPDFGSSFVISPKNTGLQWVEAEITWPDGRRVYATGSFMANAPVVNWVDDAVPAGATVSSDGGDTWNWVSASPAPMSGTKAHQSAIAAGAHSHTFNYAGAVLEVGVGDKLFVNVYLDPANMPEEIMLSWNDGSSWEHRAFWGADKLSYGTLNTASRFKAGALPAGGQWVRLELPASAVGLEGKQVSGMSFSAFGGRVTWDAAGKTSNMN